MKRLVLFLICSTTLLSFESRDNLEIFDYQKFVTHYSVKDSTHKGKATLIEFWASWCQPCRRLNGEISELYSDFKDTPTKIGNGLRVVYVALDRDSVRWSKAIKNDRIEWAEHYRDTAKWESSFLKESRVSYLPMNFLLDSSGNVVSQGLYGKHLTNKLQSLVQD